VDLMEMVLEGTLHSLKNWTCFHRRLKTELNERRHDREARIVAVQVALIVVRAQSQTGIVAHVVEMAYRRLVRNAAASGGMDPWIMVVPAVYTQALAEPSCPGGSDSSSNVGQDQGEVHGDQGA